MATNPVTLPFPYGNGAVWCFSNASYLQRISLNFSNAPANPYVFTGAGEGSLMECRGVTTQGIGSNVREPFTVVATFDYSTDNGATWVPVSVVDDPKIIETENMYIAQVGAEDSGDGDGADSWMEIVLWTTPA